MRHIDEILEKLVAQTNELKSGAEEAIDRAFPVVADEEFYRKLDERYGLEPHIYSMEFLRKT